MDFPPSKTFGECIYVCNHSFCRAKILIPFSKTETNRFKWQFYQHRITSFFFNLDFLGIFSYREDKHRRRRGWFSKRTSSEPADVPMFCGVALVYRRAASPLALAPRWRRGDLAPLGPPPHSFERCCRNAAGCRATKAEPRKRQQGQQRWGECKKKNK